MKVKIKLSVDQFKNLLAFVQRSTYPGLNELQILNLRLFISQGLKKLIDMQGIFIETLKTFSIEINQFSAIMCLLTKERNFLDPYTLSIFLTLQNQNKSLLHLS